MELFLLYNLLMYAYIFCLQFDGVTVGLRSISDPSKLVAKALVITKDPRCFVGGVELGQGWFEVNVEVPIIRGEPLIRPLRSYKTIGDAVGRNVAWPSSLVSNGLT